MSNSKPKKVVNHKSATQVVAEKAATVPTHEFIGIFRYGLNDVGLYVLKDGVAVEIARDCYDVIKTKIHDHLYRIVFQSEGK